MRETSSIPKPPPPPRSGARSFGSAWMPVSRISTRTRSSPTCTRRSISPSSPTPPWRTLLATISVTSSCRSPSPAAGRAAERRSASTRRACPAALSPPAMTTRRSMGRPGKVHDSGEFRKQTDLLQAEHREQREACERSRAEEHGPYAFGDVLIVRGEHGAQCGGSGRSAERAEEARGGGRGAEAGALDRVLDRDDEHLRDEAEAGAERQQADVDEEFRPARRHRGEPEQRGRHQRQPGDRVALVAAGAGDRAAAEDRRRRR